MVHRKEFGIQSGSLIPKIQKRAGALKALGWVQIHCEDIGPAGVRLLSENQEYIKGKAMIPTTELPTVLAKTEKENVRKTLKRQRDEKNEASRSEKKKKCEGDYELAKDCIADGNMGIIFKNGWKATLVHEHPDETGLSRLSKDVLRALYCSIGEVGI